MNNERELIKEPGEMITQVNALEFSTYDRVLFEDLSFNIKRGEVTAITGRSGSGKTVILKILAGLERQDEGSVETRSNSVSYVPQVVGDLGLAEDIPIRSLFKQVRGLDLLEEQITKFDRQIAENPNSYDAIADEYSETLEKYDDLDGYKADADISRILYGLVTSGQTSGNLTLESTLAEVSSGQKKRILLGRAIYAQPDLLLLDDPSSHLDVAGVQFLVDYLNNLNSGIVIASNNADFIDECASQTVGLTDIGRTFVFRGNYTDFSTKRDAILDSEKAEAKAVANKLDQLRETDQKFRSKQVYKRSANMAQVGRALETRMSKLEEKHDRMPGSKEVYKDDQVKDLAYTAERRSGETVVSIRRVVKRYGDYEAVDLSPKEPISIRRGEKWLIWGSNGSGKSTLARIIVNKHTGGEFVEDEGSVDIGTNVDLGYYAPDEIIVLENGRIVESVIADMPDVNTSRAVAVLRYFGFTSQAIFNQDINTLSSGELKRISLAKLMLTNPNVLLLDEPTGDYLTDELKARLAKSLSGYNGTLILVSHDSDFINQLPITKILHMPSGKIERQC